MLLRNDLLQYGEPRARIVRILWIAPDRTGAYIFDVDASAADAEPVALQTLLDDLQAGKAKLLLNDPYLVLVSQELLPQKHLQLPARLGHRAGPDRAGAGHLRAAPARPAGSRIYAPARRLASHHLPLPAALLAARPNPQCTAAGLRQLGRAR